MTGNSDQLSILGQQVLDTMIEAYNPSHDPFLALSLHPGQPLADDLVQNGVTNPLRLSEWLEGQYDYPLLLKRSDASSISTSIGNLSAKSAYLAMIPWAQPSVPPGAPAYARINAMIADARKDIGDNPDALPFNCEPGDFAETDSTAWRVFDHKITSSATTTTKVEPVPFRANPQLWKMRVLTPETIDRLTTVSDTVWHSSVLAGERPAVLQNKAIMTMRRLARPSALEARVTAMTSRKLVRAPGPKSFGPIGSISPHSNIGAASGRANLGQFEAPSIETRQFPRIALTHDQLSRTQVFDRLAAVRMHDLAAAPVVQEVTTTGSELHVHFEYCMLTITRRIAGTPWWHAELLNEDDWFVPGMKRGDMVAASADDAYALCLPQALLLVRNVAFTGAWTANARQNLASEISFLGPFLMRGAAMAANVASSEQITILGEGIQVIGELCCALPALPPQDAPP